MKPVLGLYWVEELSLLETGPIGIGDAVVDVSCPPPWTACSTAPSKS
jgi:hypothetical protein